MRASLASVGTQGVLWNTALLDRESVACGTGEGASGLATLTYTLNNTVIF